jgi:hypothetical protein
MIVRITYNQTEFKVNQVRTFKVSNYRMADTFLLMWEGPKEWIVPLANVKIIEVEK